MNPMNTTFKSLPNKTPCLRSNDEDGTSLSESSNRNTCEQPIQWTVTHTLMLSSMEGMIMFYLPKDVKALERRIKQLCRLEEAPLTEGTILRRLRTKTYYRHDKTSSGDQSAVLDQNSELCSICLVDYEDQDKVAMLYYCKHVFHVECVKKWLLQKNLCPNCRNLAFIPEIYRDWEGDIEEHQSYFSYFYDWKRRNENSNSTQASSPLALST